MQPIQSDAVAGALKQFEGRRVYLHFEFPRGGFLRNIAAEVDEVHLKGAGPYRVALKCRDHGWVLMEGLTHMQMSEGHPLFLGALESDQRLSQALQISLERMAP